MTEVSLRLQVSYFCSSMFFKNSKIGPWFHPPPPAVLARSTPRRIVTTHPSPEMLAAIASMARHTLTDQAQGAPHRRLQFARLFNQEDSVAGGACQDKNENCDGWAADGECAANPGYMHVECPLSCKRCTALASGGAAVQRRRPPVRAGCYDEEGYDCAAKAKAGGCDFDKGEMLPRCPRSCNVCHFLSTIVEAFGCDDKHPTCKSWASAGCAPLPNPNPSPNPSPSPSPSPNPNSNPGPNPSPSPNPDPNPDPNPGRRRVHRQQGVHERAVHGELRHSPEPEPEP